MDSKIKGDALTARLRDLDNRSALLLRKRFHVVNVGPSEVTITELRMLLAEAERGELIGLAWVGMYRGHEWDGASCGAALSNPARTLGMLHAYCARIAAFMNR